MRTFKVLTIIFLAGFIMSCGSKSGQQQSDFSITTNVKNNAITLGETLSLSIKNKKNHTSHVSQHTVSKRNEVFPSLYNANKNNVNWKKKIPLQLHFN